MLTASCLRIELHRSRREEAKKSHLGNHTEAYEVNMPKMSSIGASGSRRAIDGRRELVQHRVIAPSAVDQMGLMDHKLEWAIAFRSLVD